MTGTAAGMRRPETHGEAYLDGSTVITANAVWQPTGVQVVLPEAGTYELTGEAQGVLSFVLPAGQTQTNVGLSYRLYNVTAGAAVARSQRIAFLFSVLPGTFGGHHGSPTLHSVITVSGPSVIRMEAYRYQSSLGGTFNAGETRGGVADPLGETVLRWRRMDI